MQKRVRIAIIVCVSLVAGLGIWSIVAIQIARNQHPFVPTQFTGLVFLKYNSAANEPLKYTVYSVEPLSMITLSFPLGDQVIFDDEHGRYYSNRKVDRFAWVTVSPSIPTSTYFYIDAVTGELIGSYNPCPMCICHHGDKTK